MNLPKLTFKRLDQPQSSDSKLISGLIDSAQRSIKTIQDRIEYLKSLEANIAALNKAQEQHKKILDFLVKKTADDENEQAQLSKLISDIKGEIKR